MSGKRFYCRVAAAVKISPYTQSGMLYFRSLKIVQHNIFFVVFVVCSVYSLSRSFSSWVGPVYCLNTVRSPLGYVACFLNLPFDVLSVLCGLHNLRTPYKILFYLVPPIVFSFRTHTFFYFEAIRRLSRAGTCVMLKIP